MPRAADVMKKIGRGLGKVYHALSGPGRAVEKFLGPDPIKNAEGESVPPGYFSKSSWWGNWSNWFTSKKVVITTGISFFLTYASLTSGLAFLSILGPVVLPLFLLSLVFCLPMPPAVRRGLATLVGFAATVLSVTVMVLMIPIHGFKHMSLNPLTAIKSALNFWTQTVPGFFTQGGGASAISALSGAGSAVGKFFMGSAGKVGAFKFSAFGLGAMGPVAGLVLASVAAAGILSLLVYGGYKLFRGIKNFFKTVSAEDANNIKETEKNFRDAKKELNLKLDVLEQQLGSQKKNFKLSSNTDKKMLNTRIESTKENIKKVKGLLKQASKSGLTLDAKARLATDVQDTAIQNLPMRRAPDFVNNFNLIPELKSRIREERSSLKAELETIQYLRKHTDNVDQRTVYKDSEKDIKSKLSGLDKAEKALNKNLENIRKQKKQALTGEAAIKKCNEIIESFQTALRDNHGPEIDFSDLSQTAQSSQPVRPAARDSASGVRIPAPSGGQSQHSTSEAPERRIDGARHLPKSHRKRAKQGEEADRGLGQDPNNPSASSASAGETDAPPRGGYEL